MNRANTVVEYAMIIVIIVAVLIGMYVYMQRVLCGRWRDAADSIGMGYQYNPLETQVITP